MKSINKISIENVKGISKETFDVTLLPFMPTFFVAPNGFGKSSLAIAFNSLNRDRLKIDPKHYHLGNDKAESLLQITIAEDNNTPKVLSADKKKNEISKVFDIEVIKGLLKPEANYKNILGKPVTSPSIEVENIYIIENVPEKYQIPYQVSKFKASISDNRLIWTDISDMLNDDHFIFKLNKLGVLDKFDLIKQNALLEAYKSTIKTTTGNKEFIINELNKNHLSILEDDFLNLSRIL